MVRRADPIVIRIKTPRKSRSIPKRLAQLVAKGEKIANVRGKTRQEAERTHLDTKLAAISDKTVDRVVNGALKTTPSKRIPGMRKREWFPFHNVPPYSNMNSIRIIIAQELRGGKRNYRGIKPCKIAILLINIVNNRKIELKKFLKVLKISSHICL